MTKSMHSALRDLNLDRLYVIHSGTDCYEMDDRTEALGILQLNTRLAEFRTQTPH
jgi:hypothetical protein